MICKCGNESPYIYDKECISCKTFTTPCFVCNNSLQGVRHRREIEDTYSKVIITVCPTCYRLSDDTILYLINKRGK